MRRIFAQVTIAGAIIVLAGSLPGGHTCAGFVLWYNGDYHGNDAPSNQGTRGVAPNLVYDDFIVPAGQTDAITSVFSNDFILTGSSLPTTATWA